MENMDPTDPNLDGDFKALIKRRDQLARQQTDKEDEAKLVETYAKRAAAKMGNKRTRPRHSIKDAPPAELFDIRCKLFWAAESEGLQTCKKELSVLRNHRIYSGKSLTDSDLRDPEDNRTVLHHAVIHKNKDAIEFFMEIADEGLLMAAYNVHSSTIQTKKNTIHLLVELGDSELTKIFLNKIHKSSKKADFLKQTALMEMQGQRPRQLTPIHMAALQGNTTIMDQLIDAGMSVNIQNSKKDTPLIWAARWNHIETAKRLLDLGADSNLENDKFSTPLYWAVRYGFVDMVRLLLSTGNADINFRRKLGFEVSIVLAAALSYNEILQVLLDNGANINDKTSAGQTALHVAAIYGNNNIVDTLLDNDPMANIESQDNLGNTALMYAVKGGHLTTAKNLLSSGAHIHSANVYGETIWDAAIESKDEGMLDLVVDFYKSSRRMADKLIFPVGKTPLHLAAMKGNVDHIEMLLSKGADVRTVDYGGNTFYHLAARENKVKVLETFFDKVDINLQNSDGNTPIHLACQQGHIESVLILLKKAQLGIKNNLQETVLHCCAKCTHDTAPTVAGKVLTAIVKTQSWSMMDSQNVQGDTALHTAARNGNPELAQELNSLNPKIKNKEGSNPLHVAAFADNKEMLKQLLVVFHVPSTGLNINDTKSDGETILHICAKSGDSEMVQLLIRRGADLTKTDKSGNTVLHDLAYQSTVDLSNNEQHLQVFQAVVDNCTQWWCVKHDLFFPDRGSPAYKEAQREALIHLTEEVYNNMNLSVKTYASYVAATGILQAIFNIPDVFCFKKSEYYEYDVTNVSPETMVEKVKSKRKSKLFNQSTVDPYEEDDNDTIEKSTPVILDSKSCLDVIVEMDNLVSATKVLDVTPIHYIVEDYWNVYRFIFGLLMIFHIVYMSLYTAYCIPLATEVWTTSNTTVVPNSAYGAFLLPPIVILIFALYFILYSIISMCRRKSPIGYKGSGAKSISFKTWCSDGLFGFIFKFFEIILDHLFLISGIVFSVLIIVWYILYMLGNKDQVYLLSVALLVGWTYTIAYSKGFQTVHAFTIMLREIIIRDITRFGFIYCFILLAFGFAMHSLFQISPSVASNYPSYGHTLFDTFNMMIGMGEVINDNTDGDFSSIGSNSLYLRIVYLIYMIASAIILLNLLIAMMSDSYNTIKSKEGTTWRVGSVKMALGIEHSMNIIATVFNALRSSQARLPIIFDATTRRHMIQIPVGEIEKIVSGEENEITKSLKILESKLNFLNAHFIDMNNKFVEVIDRCNGLEEDISQIHQKLGINEIKGVRPRTARRRLTMQPDEKAII